MSDIIQTFMEEHKKISESMEDLKKKCLIFLEQDQIDLEEFREAVSFIRSFVDKQHHQREEKLLFQAMMEELGEAAVNLVQHGMMVEHDLARLYAGALDAALKDWEESPGGENKLQILANAMGYYYLMVRHIDRENQVIYPYARRSLSQETLQKLNKELENDTETF